jgi:hypothetical protein
VLPAGATLHSFEKILPADEGTLNINGTTRGTAQIDHFSSVSPIGRVSNEMHYTSIRWQGPLSKGGGAY